MTTQTPFHHDTTRPARWARRGLTTLLMAATLALPLALTACGGGGGARSSRPVTMKGSDTMVILGQRWAEVYMQTHPGMTVQVTGGGSGTGIAALINGTTTICQASRSMKDSEKEQIQAKSGAPVEEHAVAMDGITVYVQKESPGADREANWLPAPEGPFQMILRLYWPKEVALGGGWTAPKAVKS